MANSVTTGPPSLPLGSRAARGAATLLTLRLGLWTLSLAQNVVVARTIVPRELGLYAMALAIVTLSVRLKQLGSAEKLIRDPDEELRTAFGAATVVEVGVGIVAMIVLAAGALLIPWAGAEPRARVVIAALSVLMLQSASDLPVALFHRRLEFRRLALRRALEGLLVVAATIAAAVGGLQVWALVVGQLVGVVAAALLFWRGVDPPPRLAFESSSIRAYLSFGLPLWGSGLLYALAERGSILVVSSVLGLSTLGYVHLAQALLLRLNQGNDAANAAIYPALRALVDKPNALRAVLERTIRVFALAGVVCGVALALFAGEWVPKFFGAAWSPAIPFVSVYCLTWGFSAIGYPCYLAFQVRGDTRTVFTFGASGFLARFVVIAAGVVWLGELGLLIGIASTAAINIAAREAMIRRMFPDFSLLRLSAGSVLVASCALGAERLVHLFSSTASGPVRLAVFAAAAAGAAALFDRATVGDAAAQVRGAIHGLSSAPS